MIESKGYTAELTIDLDDDVIQGRVVGIRDVVTFQGNTVAEARAELTVSVDGYLAFCAHRNKEPNVPDSDNLLVGTDPDIHRRLRDEAAAD